MSQTTWDSELYEAKHSFVWKFGSDLITQLQPRPGERIVDLGCGTGQLTARIAESGADVLGVDSSPEMIGQARQNYPQLRFLLADAAGFRVPQPVDAVFSNAALHWVRDAKAAVHSIADCLNPGGRLVAEFGGQGNVAVILNALSAALERRGAVYAHPWYFPGLIEYAALLEEQGMTVRAISLTDRPTPLEDGPKGLRQWLQMFASGALSLVPRRELPAFFVELEDELRPRLFQTDRWIADYRRLRVEAIRAAVA